MKRIVIENRVELTELAHKLRVSLSYNGSSFYSTYISYDDIKEYYGDVAEDTIEELNSAISRYDCVVEDVTDRQFVDGKFIHTGKFYTYNKHITLPPLTDKEIKVVQDSIDKIKSQI